MQKRLHAELDACRDPARLKSAGEQSGLGVRSNRPRVYVVAGLMGGSGSGMFLDLAYTVRMLLRRLGYGWPDVVGLLFAPMISTRASRQGTSSPGVPGHAPPGATARTPLPLGNACAALAELHHFARPDAEFSARYLEKESPLTDPGPPFARTVLLPIPEEAQTRAAAEVVGMAARFLLDDSCFGLGKLSSAARAGLPAPPPARCGQYFETFGTYRLTVPRRQVVRRLAALCVQKLVRRWVSKDTKALEDPVRGWVEEQWRGHELGAEHFIGRVQQACEKRLGKAPEAAFNAALQPLLAKLGEGPTAGPKSSGRSKPDKNKPIAVLNPEDVAEVLARYQDMLGKPEGVEDTAPAAAPGDAPPPPAPLPQALHEAASAITGEWSQKLAELPVRLIEQPTFRLAGAEEAVRQVVASIEKVLSIHEPLAHELSDRATQAYAKLMLLLAHANDPRSWPRRGTATPQEVLDLLRNYPKFRHQALVLQQVLGVYVSLRGHLTDTLREINFCRVRLGELATAFADPPEADKPAHRRSKEEYAAEVEGPGKYLFPEGCQDLAQAVSRGETALGSEALLELDARIQKVMRSQFGSLVQVCLATKNVTRNVAAVMRETAEAFVEERLERTDVARLFLDQHPDEDTAVDELIALYEEAVPEPSRTMQARTVAAQAEVTVLRAPAGAGGEAVRDLAQSALADTSLVTVAAGDDLVVYREWSNLALTDLENLGPVGQEAYRQLLNIDNFTPHSRLDIEFELPL